MLSILKTRIEFPNRKANIQFSFDNFQSFSGAEGDRTHDLLNAIQALSQLSYGPILLLSMRLKIINEPRLVKRFLLPVIPIAFCKTKYIYDIYYPSCLIAIFSAVYLYAYGKTAYKTRRTVEAA